MSKSREEQLEQRVREAYARRESAVEPTPFAAVWSRAERRPPAFVFPKPALALAASATLVALLTLLSPDELGEFDEFTEELTVTVLWRSPTDELLDFGLEVDALSLSPEIDLPAALPESWDVPEDRS